VFSTGRSLCRSVVAGVMAVGFVFSAVSPVSARTGGADLAVELTAVPSYFFAEVRYTVAVTNTGPQPLTSATVTVAVDPRVWPTTTTPCVLNSTNATLTCSFAALAPGATAKASTVVAFNLPSAPTSVNATATRTASTPNDTNSSNDTDTANCRYESDQVGFPPWPYRLYC
jgi:hypothetical protein